ncbi:MAG: SAM-dependent DNA methyltransferase [Thermodesulfobacteriota bacterium]
MPSSQHFLSRPRSGKKNRSIAEYGDYQTPLELAREVCGLLVRQGFRPKSVLEPTCGTGSFLVAALEAFPSIEQPIGLEINGNHAAEALAAVRRCAGTTEPLIVNEDFFSADWPAILSCLPPPLLIVGNPPWVTNSEMGALGGTNVPPRANFTNLRGIEAITGASNFDISEWMLMKALEWIEAKSGVLAMLCKTSTARKVLFHTWRSGRLTLDASMFPVDAAKHFGVTVDACLLLVKGVGSHGTRECSVAAGIAQSGSVVTFGLRSNGLVADVKTYDSVAGLEGMQRGTWRSGVKHDCARVMELRREGKRWRNGLGEIVELEPNYLYPMLKSSDLSRNKLAPSRWMLVTQRCINDETSSIQTIAPRTWQYLTDHGQLLDRRASSVYAKRPRFSVFGVGPYTFAPWKVAISGFARDLRFHVIGPWEQTSVVLDDTCYFVPCQESEQAQLLFTLLSSKRARRFFQSLIFWDAKRPVTAAVLRRLDLKILARESGLACTDCGWPWGSGVESNQIP